MFRETSGEIGGNGASEHNNLIIKSIPEKELFIPFFPELELEVLKFFRPQDVFYDKARILRQWHIYC